MTTYWCANFDFANVLNHGLEINAWLMQYQYEHSGFDYQGTRRQKGRTTETWKSLTDISTGDWILAYLSGNAFFAVGQICAPRVPNGRAVYTDRVGRTVKEARHLHFDGIVQYADAPAFYEDFTDPWKISIEPPRQGQPPNWFYSQRIAVAKWENVVPDGIEMTGLATAAPFPGYRKPIFQVDAIFFHDVAEGLRVASVNDK